jgi:hypothetical protein
MTAALLLALLWYVAVETAVSRGPARLRYPPCVGAGR